MATANFKVSTGVVPGQHVYTRDLVFGHTYTLIVTHVCTCACVDTLYLRFLAPEHTHTQNTHTAQSGLISGPSELREAVNQGQLTALGI